MCVCVYLKLNLHGMLTLRRSTRRYIGLRSTQLMTEIASTNSNVGTVVPGFDAEVSQNLKYTVVIGEKGRSKKNKIEPAGLTLIAVMLLSFCPVV